jgi:hypothetical protein
LPHQITTAIDDAVNCVPYILAQPRAANVRSAVKAVITRAAGAPAAVRSALFASAVWLADTGAVNAQFLLTGTGAAVAAAAISTTNNVRTSGLADAGTIDADILVPRAEAAGAVAAVGPTDFATACGLTFTGATNAQLLRSQARSTRTSAAVPAAFLAVTIGGAVVAFAVGTSVLARQGLLAQNPAAIYPADIPVAAIGVVLRNADATASLADLSTGANTTDAVTSIGTAFLLFARCDAKTIAVGADVLGSDTPAAIPTAAIGPALLPQAV